ncbi:DUF6421 family protein [Nocardia sp. CDC160]|uniref:DUF6421 family protein n=1 Tax=Nocardia sp. CDC160 TaxID=3112166 RepID=UPI002DBAABDB|nr:DUF6421 family protein [Nocardia sp. CDC160]MEC3920349.1 DUF6421 family protein [Nocardia sp. CDC160]
MTPLTQAARDPAWADLKDGIHKLQLVQTADGGIDADNNRTVAAHRLVWRIANAVATMARYFPYDREYLDAVVNDLRNWARAGFDIPDFSSSMYAFQSTRIREDGRTHLVLFPIYARNSGGECRFEAMLVSETWPDWLDDLERTRFAADSYKPLMLADFTGGYEARPGAFFPDTISASRSAADNVDHSLHLFACEAARFRAVCSTAVSSLQMQLPRDYALPLHEGHSSQQAFLLLGLLRDWSRPTADQLLGEIPDDERGPFWISALAQLRVDVNAYLAAADLRNEEHPIGSMVPGIILLDTMLRAPLFGRRVRNVESLAGQLLFAFLQHHRALRWTGGKLRIDDSITDAVEHLSYEIDSLISRGDSGHALWTAGHRLVSRFVPPRRGSGWDEGSGSLTSVAPDEFPLEAFFVRLSSRVSEFTAGSLSVL